MALFDGLFKSNQSRKQEEEMAKRRAARKANRAVRKGENDIQRLQKECDALEAEAKQLIRSGNKTNQSRINYLSKLYQSKKNTVEQLRKSQLANEHAIGSIGIAATITETTDAIANYSKVAAPDISKLDQNQQTISDITDTLADITDIVEEGYENAVDSINESTVEGANDVDLQINAWTAEVQAEISGVENSGSGVNNATASDDSLAARIARLDANTK